MRILGVDLGTQSCKAVVLGDGFAVRGEHAVPVETAHPGPGQAEQDPRAWERAAEAAIAGALKASGDAARDIEAMGVSGQLDGCVAVVLGTAEVVGALAETPVRDPAASPMVETHAYPTGCCFVENPGWLSGGAVRWVTRLLGLADDRALDRLAATAPPGSDGVVFIPALTGAMTPVWRSHARGTLHGLTATHGPQHIARAVLEGLAFACRDVVERLASLGLATDEVLLLGGGSRSPLWRQIRADVLGRPHAVASNPDSCPIGAGMVAAVASGAVPELPGVAEPVVRVEPGADRAAMDDAYGRYGRLVTQVAPLGDSPW